MPKACLMLIAALPGLMWAQAAPAPDFAGTWKLDTLRSRFENLPTPKSLVLQIDQQNSTVDVKMTTVTHDGESTETYQLKAPASNPSAAWDGDHLVLQCHHNTPNGPVEMTRRLKRGDKGKIMTAVLTVKDQSGVHTAYEFYVKE
jgi:hypothetical protein